MSAPSTPGGGDPAGPGPGPTPAASPPAGPRPPGAAPQRVGALVATSLALYRRRTLPLLLVATAFVIPSALLGVLQQRAEEEPARAAGEGAPAASPAPASAAPSPEAPPGAPPPGVTPVPPSPSPSPAPAAPAAGPEPAAASPAPPLPAGGEDALARLPGARELAVRGVWALIGGLFTTMLAAAVAREGALAVTGREPQPGRSIGYGLTHVLGLGLVGALAALSTALLLMVFFPFFFLASLLQRAVPVLGTALALAGSIPLALAFVALVSLGVPVYVVEGRRGLAALSRVWQLARGAVGHVAAATLLLLLVGLTASGAAMGLAAVTGSSLLPVVLTGIAAAPLEGLLGFVLYLDLRARRERFGAAGLQADLARHAP